jgi:hypothetical protein
MPSRSSLVIKPVASLLSGLRSLYQRPSETISGIDPQNWGSPSQPVKPWGPPSAEPRQFQTWEGQNLIFTPRSDADYSAADLKALSTYPLARICIENVKDTVTWAPWEIQMRARPLESRAEVQSRAKDNRETLVLLNRFFEYPDREHNWQEWLRPLLDDMLVIDAGSVLMRKTRGGDLAELAVIRGELITRYIDENGFTPMPPSPAYAQNFWGVPWVDLTTDQLVYKPRNIAPRNSLSSQLYGFSPTEQMAPEIQIGMKRLEFVSSYYGEGSVPGVVQVAPRGTSPDRIQEAMEWMNSQLAGNLAARNQWRIIQGFNEPGKPDQIEYTKEPLLAGLYDEKHIREIAFGYGTSPQRLMKMIRTEGKGASDSAEVEGTLPWVLWVKGVVDFIIQQKMGLVDFEIALNPYAEPDPLKNAAALTMLVSKAILTPNEARKRVGEELRPEPEADRLGVISGTGFVPIGIPSVTAGVMIDEQGNAKPHPVTPTPGAAPATDPNAGRSGTPASQEAGSGRSTGRNVGTPNGSESLDGKKKLLKRLGARIETGVLSVESQQSVHHIQTALQKVFKKQRTAARVLRKSVEDDEKRIAEAILAAMAAEWENLPFEIQSALESAVLSGVNQGILQLDVTSTVLIAQANNIAQRYAQDRAAELVGMARDTEGALVPNPDARWTISQTTRERIQQIVADAFSQETPLPEIEDAIQTALSEETEGNGIFSDARAAMIARTEVSMAQSGGNFTAWQESGVVRKVKWLVSNLEPCPICLGNENQEVNLGEMFRSGVERPPQHPNCACILAVTQAGATE